MTFAVGAVAHGEEDDVALVALHVFQVLDENRFLHIEGQLFQLWFPGEAFQQNVLDEVLLHFAERHDANALLREFGIRQTAHHFADDGLGLGTVRTGAALVVGAFNLH